MWHDGMKIGIEEVDRQHKELFDRLEGLLEECARGECQESLPNMLDFLDGYVVTHFATEEELMKEGEYPGYPAHRAEHVAFIERLAAIRRAAAEQGMTPNLMLNINQFLIDWLQGHIFVVDRQMGAFLTQS